MLQRKHLKLIRFYAPFNGEGKQLANGPTGKLASRAVGQAKQIKQQNQWQFAWPTRRIRAQSILSQLASSFHYDYENGLINC